MPKAPILNRESFYETLENGTMRLLDWNLVNTSLGAMVEPRQLSVIPVSGKVVHVDVNDLSFNKLSPLKEDEFYKLMGTGGRQVPLNWNK